MPITGRKNQWSEPRCGRTAALGLQSYHEILSQSQIVSSGPQVDLVKRVGERLKKVIDDPRISMGIQPHSIRAR